MDAAMKAMRFHLMPYTDLDLIGFELPEVAAE